MSLVWQSRLSAATHDLRNHIQSHHSFLQSFQSRLLLVCAQLLIYYQRFNLSKDCIRACYEFVKEHSDELDTAYRNKITVEFVKAMKEAEEENANGEAFRSTDKHSASDENDEAVLEAMLDAEESGYGEFRDDFDEMNEESRDEQDADEDDDSDSEEGVTFLFGKRPPDATNRQINDKKAKTEGS